MERLQSIIASVRARSFLILTLWPQLDVAALSVKLVIGLMFLRMGGRMKIEQFECDDLDFGQSRSIDNPLKCFICNMIGDLRK
ncbi:hypothetical protein Trydic_g19743 [Trypoxylus dichotomus]